MVEEALRQAWLKAERAALRHPVSSYEDLQPVDTQRHKHMIRSEMWSSHGDNS